MSDQEIIYTPEEQAFLDELPPRMKSLSKLHYHFLQKLMAKPSLIGLYELELAMDNG